MENAKPTLGTVELLSVLQNNGARYAICSNSRSEEIHTVLKTTKLDKFFADMPIFGREMVQKGKPASDIYLFALKEMNVLPQNAVVVEDSLNGVMASVGAGIQTVVFTGGTGFLGMNRFVERFGSIPNISSMADLI